MNEQLIEKFLEKWTNVHTSSRAEMREDLLALTSVKSESAEGVAIKMIQSEFGKDYIFEVGGNMHSEIPINANRIKNLMINYIQAMHDFANNSNKDK